MPVYPPTTGNIYMPNVTGGATTFGVGCWYFSPWPVTGTAAAQPMSDTSTVTIVASALYFAPTGSASTYLNQAPRQFGLQTIANGATLDIGPPVAPAVIPRRWGEDLGLTMGEERALDHLERVAADLPIPPNPARVEASRKAVALLRACLNETQRAEFDANRSFRVTGRSGARYRVRWGRIANIDLIERIRPAEDAVAATYCVHPAADVPVGDVMLAQKFHLETDDAALLRIANRHPAYRAA